MEIVIVIAILALYIIAVYIKNTVYPDRKQERLQIVKKYRQMQQLSMQLQDNLSKYILQNDAFENSINDISCGEYLKKLQQDHAELLSEDTYIKIKNGASSGYRKKIKLLLAIQSKRLKKARKDINRLQKNKRPA